MSVEHAGGPEHILMENCEDMDGRGANFGRVEPSVDGKPTLAGDEERENICDGKGRHERDVDSAQRLC